jgi:hypothetical protein
LLLLFFYNYVRTCIVVARSCHLVVAAAHDEQVGPANHRKRSPRPRRRLPRPLQGSRGLLRGLLPGLSFLPGLRSGLGVASSTATVTAAADAIPPASHVCYLATCLADGSVDGPAARAAFGVAPYRALLWRCGDFGRGLTAWQVIEAVGGAGGMRVVSEA